ncbi:MAG: DUF4855 domain-containing protein [Oscillospiraceae bacterium]|nr:DUF4855 domain-containing protein [Oscillospiraceae bacterium]
MMRLRLKRVFSVILAGLLLSLPIVGLSAGAAGETVLSVGKSYTLKYDSEIDGAYPAKAYEPESSLTDGVFAARAAASDPAYLRLYRGTAVIVTIDLEAVCAVSSVEVSSLQSGGGIVCPRYVHVAVSEDGESFGTVGTLEDPNSVTNNQARSIKHKVELDQTYRARYVRVTFSSDVHTYIDEISVYGSTDASGAAAAKADAPVEDRGFGPQIDGIGNVVLMYTVGNYTEDQLLPYLLYQDTDGNFADTMFDAMLFLPSGTSNYDYTVAEGWEKYLADMLGATSKNNLTALNSVVGKHSEELGGKKYPVFLSVPFLAPGNKDINGVTPNNLENRFQIIQAFIDRMVDAFNASGFDNLELKGLYWHEELVQYTLSNYEEELIKQFNEYAHGKGLKTIWIPYFGAPGAERAVELGFDCATLQSGYAFGRDASVVAEIGESTPKAVEDSAAEAKKYGLGMEFELDVGRTDFLDRYYKYVHTGYKTGCMDGHMMMLYQSVAGIYGCAKSPKASGQRQVYDMTYLYIKGKFTSYPPEIAPKQYIVAAAGGRSSGKLEVADPDTIRGTLKTAETNIPEGLPFVVEGDGFYVLNAGSVTPGSYEVSFSVTDGYNVSAMETVKILLYDPEDAGIALNLSGEVTAYTRLDPSANTVTIPAGAATARWLENGWYHVTAEVNGKKVSGFAEATALGLSDTPSGSGDPGSDELSGTEETSDSDGFPGWAIGVIAGGVVLLAAAAGLIVALTKKGKHNSTKKAD